MKNITVSISEALALKLRVEAAKADKSLSRFLAETLERALFGAPGTSGERVAARIGAGAGEFEVPDNIDASNAEIARLFGVAADGSSEPSGAAKRT